MPDPILTTATDTLRTLMGGNAAEPYIKAVEKAVRSRDAELAAALEEAIVAAWCRDWPDVDRAQKKIRALTGVRLSTTLAALLAKRRPGTI